MSAARTLKGNIAFFILVFCSDIVMMENGTSVCWPVDGNSFISLIASCPDSETDDTLIQKCEHPVYPHMKIKSYVPWYDKKENIFYRNEYCALCSNASSNQLTQATYKIKCLKDIRSSSQEKKESRLTVMIHIRECTFVIPQIIFGKLRCSIWENQCSNENKTSTGTYFGYMTTNSTRLWYRFQNLECCKRSSSICINFPTMRSRLFYQALRAVLYGEDKVTGEPFLNHSVQNSTKGSTSWFHTINIGTTIFVLISSVVLIILYSTVKPLSTYNTYMIVVIGVDIACIETVNLMVAYLCSDCRFSVCEYLIMGSIFFHISETVCIAQYIDSFWDYMLRMKHRNRNVDMGDHKMYILFLFLSFLVPLILCCTLVLYDKFYTWNPKTNLIHLCLMSSVMAMVLFYIIPTLIILIYTSMVCFKISAHLRKSVLTDQNCPTASEIKSNADLGIKLDCIIIFTWLLNMAMIIFPSKTILKAGMILSHFNGFVFIVCFLSTAVVRKWITL